MADEKRNMRHDVAVATGFVRGFVRHLVKGDQPPESGEPQEPSAPGEPQAQEPSAPGETEAHAATGPRRGPSGRGGASRSGAIAGRPAGP